MKLILYQMRHGMMQYCLSKVLACRSDYMMGPILRLLLLTFIPWHLKPSSIMIATIPMWPAEQFWVCVPQFQAGLAGLHQKERLPLGG